MKLYFVISYLQDHFRGPVENIVSFQAMRLDQFKTRLVCIKIRYRPNSMQIKSRQTAVNKLNQIIVSLHKTEWFEAISFES